MKLYFKFAAMHLKSHMQYKASFAMAAIGQLIASLGTLVGLNFIFMRFSEIEGFTHPQALLCYAIVLMAYSLAEFLGRGFDSFAQMLGNGEYDRALVRPRSAIAQVLLSKMEFSRIGKLIQAVFVLAYAIPKCGAIWSLPRIIALVLMVICGAIVFFALFIVNAALTFFTVEGLEFINIFTDGGREFGRYPYSVYGKKVLLFLTFAVPLALFQYYPLLFIIGKSDNIAYMLAPAASTLFLVPSLLLFSYGARHYQSTGS
ncbi:MAG: ABC-2 family transporter protein [Eubacteriaceae bacterium]|nr:ABC-2 family transporter protein [Eubacteriaceae bacterium]